LLDVSGCYIQTVQFTVVKSTGWGNIFATL